LVHDEEIFYKNALKINNKLKKMMKITTLIKFNNKMSNKFGIMKKTLLNNKWKSWKIKKQLIFMRKNLISNKFLFIK
jgi:hypothetical protein